jgi:hypothetical protein
VHLLDNIKKYCFWNRYFTVVHIARYHNPINVLKTIARLIILLLNLLLPQTPLHSLTVLNYKGQLFYKITLIIFIRKSRNVGHTELYKDTRTLQKFWTTCGYLASITVLICVYNFHASKLHLSVLPMYRRQLAQATTLLVPMRKLLGSNYGRDTDNTGGGFAWFSLVSTTKSPK